VCFELRTIPIDDLEASATSALINLSTPVTTPHITKLYAHTSEHISTYIFYGLFEMLIFASNKVGSRQTK